MSEKNSKEELKDIVEDTANLGESKGLANKTSLLNNVWDTADSTDKKIVSNLITGKKNK